MYKQVIKPVEYVAVSEESMMDNVGQRFSDFMEQQILVSTILYFFKY